MKKDCRPTLNEHGEDVILPESIQLALGGKDNIKTCQKHHEGGVHIIVKNKDLIDEERLKQEGAEMLFKLSEELVYLSAFLPS